MFVSMKITKKEIFFRIDRLLNLIHDDFIYEVEKVEFNGNRLRCHVLLTKLLILNNINIPSQLVGLNGIYKAVKNKNKLNGWSV